MDPISEARRQWEAHGWSDAAPGMAAVTTIVRVQQILVSRIEETLAPLQLTFPRFEILRLLGFTRRGQLPMGKIGQRLQVHPASVTSAVKRLERDGLITRQPDDTDRRVVIAAITLHGRSILEDATKRINEIFETLELDQEDLDSLVAALGPFRLTAGDHVDHQPQPRVEDTAQRTPPP
ncbi:MAG: MarR family transcriptional regulator [Acidimicrobiia bacterium]|nr:MarR family transcriptional regulator [Acidimicrobiia bacterium]